MGFSVRAQHAEPAANRPPGRWRLFLALAFLVAFCAAAQAPAPADEKTLRVAAGVTYRHLVKITPAGEPWSIHILEIDRHEKTTALRAVEGRDPQGQMQRVLPTELAAHATREGADVVAVVNADFDLAAPYLGIPEGLSVTSGELWTTPKPDSPAAAGWPEIGRLRNGEPVIGMPAVEMDFSAGKLKWQVASLNKPMGFISGDAPRLYSSAFGPSVKREKAFRALVIEKLSPALPLHSTGTVHGRVTQSIDSTSEVAIPRGGLVLAFPAPRLPADGAPSTTALLPQLGARVKLRIRAGVAGRAPVEDSAGGSHIIVRGGKRTIEGPHSDNLLLRHPRTAACYNAREWIFVVVDGRQPQLSVGMTLDELGALMVSLGCTEAINLDGGGSSMMALRLPAGGSPSPATDPLHIMNSPSDGKERGRGNAWLIVRKR